MQCLTSMSSATSALLLQAYLCVCMQSHEADVGEIFSVSARYGLV